MFSLNPLTMFIVQSFDVSLFKETWIDETNFLIDGLNVESKRLTFLNEEDCKMVNRLNQEWNDDSKTEKLLNLFDQSEKTEITPLIRVGK